MEPDHHRGGSAQPGREIQVAAHVVAEVDGHAADAPGCPAVVGHEAGFVRGQELRLADRRQGGRFLAQQPAHPVGGRGGRIDGQVRLVLPGAPSVPVEVVEQGFRKLRDACRAASEGQVDPVEVAGPVGGGNGLGRGTRAMAAGPVIDAKMLFRAEEAIDFPALQVGLLHREGSFRTVVVRGVDQAGARRDQGIPAMGVDGQFVLTSGVGAQGAEEPIPGKVDRGLEEAGAALQAVGTGCG